MKKFTENVIPNSRKIKTKPSVFNSFNINKKFIRNFNKIDPKTQKQLFSACFIIIFMLTGGLLLITSHAQTPSPFASINADKGTLCGGATIQTDSTSSDGSNVSFGPNTGSTCSGGGLAPVNTVAPYFTASTGYTTSCTNGCSIVGQTLTVSTGSWSNSPNSYKYQWQDCTTTSAQPPTTAGCTNVSTGGTSNSYTVQASDVGKSLVPIVTAYNNGTPSIPTTISGSRCDTGEIPFINPDAAYNDASRTPGPIVAGVGCSPISAEVGTNQTTERFCSNSPTTCGYGDPLAGTVGVPPGTTLTTVSSLSLGTGGCNALGSPSYCTPHGASSCTSSNPCVINAVSGSGLSVSGSGDYWTVNNSQFMQATQDCVVCVSGGPLTLHDVTIGGVDNSTNEAAFGAYNTSYVTSNLTLNGVYFYNGERISEDASTVENSFCWENGGVASSHHECHHGCGGPTRGFDSINNVYVQPWGETGNFDQEDDDASYCNAQPGPAISSNNDLLIGGGAYNIYPGAVTACGTSNITDDRFSRYYWNDGGQWGVNHDPGCPTMTWTGNIWDDTGVTVTQSG